MGHRLVCVVALAADAEFAVDAEVPWQPEVFASMWGHNIAVDASNVYWTGDGVRMKPKQGGAATPLSSVSSGRAYQGLAVSHRDQRGRAGQRRHQRLLHRRRRQRDLDWAESSVWRAPITGGAPILIASGIDERLPDGIAVDDTHLYWALYGGGAGGNAIMRCHK